MGAAARAHPPRLQDRHRRRQSRNHRARRNRGRDGPLAAGGGRGAVHHPRHGEPRWSHPRRTDGGSRDLRHHRGGVGRAGARLARRTADRHVGARGAGILQRSGAGRRRHRDREPREAAHGLFLGYARQRSPEDVRGRAWQARRGRGDAWRRDADRVRERNPRHREGDRARGTAARRRGDRRGPAPRDEAAARGSARPFRRGGDRAAGGGAPPAAAAAVRGDRSAGGGPAREKHQRRRTRSQRDRPRGARLHDRTRTAGTEGTVHSSDRGARPHARNRGQRHRSRTRGCDHHEGRAGARCPEDLPQRSHIAHTQQREDPHPLRHRPRGDRARPRIPRLGGYRRHGARRADP